jgi:hypothetical protein
MRVENQKKLGFEKTQVYAQKPRLKMLFKNSYTESLVSEDFTCHKLNFKLSFLYFKQVKGPKTYLCIGTNAF